MIIFNQFRVVHTTIEIRIWVLQYYLNWRGIRIGHKHDGHFLTLAFQPNRMRDNRMEGVDNQLKMIRLRTSTQQSETNMKSRVDWLNKKIYSSWEEAYINIYVYVDIMVWTRSKQTNRKYYYSAYAYALYVQSIVLCTFE